MGTATFADRSGFCHVRVHVHILFDLMENRGDPHHWGDPMDEDIYLDKPPQRSKTPLSVI